MIQEKLNPYLRRFGPAILFLAGLSLIIITAQKPLGDFGNYYYGCKVYSEGRNLDSLYSDIHWFNEQIASYGEKDFFNNYIPVPPFSLVFYMPFTWLEAHAAKATFNIIALILFVLSLRRFTRYFAPHLPLAYFLPLLLFYPFYQNFVQGQSYLLVCAALMEIALHFEKRNYWLCALLVAFIFHLKIFPAFVLLYFLFRREWRVLLYSCIAISVLFAVCLMFVGASPLKIYFLEVFPRFFKGEVLYPSYYGHQGMAVFLKNIFNQRSWYFVIVYGMISGFAFATGWVMSKMPDRKIGFQFFIFLSIFLSAYTTVYALILLVPFLLSLEGRRGGALNIILLLLACNIPLAYLYNSVLVLKFIRIELFILVFLIFIAGQKLNLNPAPILFFGAVFLAIQFGLRPEISKGIPAGDGFRVAYQFRDVNNFVVVDYCGGDKHFHDTVLLLKRRPHLILTDGAIIQKLSGEKTKGRNAVCTEEDIYYLSDKGRGKGLYIPRVKGMLE